MRIAHRSARRPAGALGFTLLELLVVIGVIGILSSFLLVTLTSVIRQDRSGRTKEILASVRAGLAAYRADQGAYPGALGAPGADETLALYRAMRNAPTKAGGGGRARPYIDPPSEHYGFLRTDVDATIAPSSGVVLHHTAEAATLGDRHRADDAAFQLTPRGRLLVLTDAWGNALVYREWEQKPPADKVIALAKITFDLYSIGPNGRDDGGRGDDIH